MDREEPSAKFIPTSPRPMVVGNISLDGTENATEALGRFREHAKMLLTATRDQRRPLLELRLTGRVGFHPFELGRERLQAELEKIADPLHVGIKNHLSLVTRTGNSETAKKSLAESLNQEEQTLAGIRQGLLADANTLATAARLENLRKDLDEVKSELGRLLGTRTNLQEGWDKLAEGNCPFFQEPCRNIIGKQPRNVFTTKIEKIDREILKIDQMLQKLAGEISGTENARKQIEALKVQREELDKQMHSLELRKKRNQARSAAVEKLQNEKIAAEGKIAVCRKSLTTFA